MMQQRPIDKLFPTLRDDQAAGKCAMARVNCCHGDGTAGEFRDRLSAEEYGLSGLCQKCQDVAFADPGDDEDDELFPEPGDLPEPEFPDGIWWEMHER
jgi:hypothetical protein